MWHIHRVGSIHPLKKGKMRLFEARKYYNVGENKPDSFDLRSYVGSRF